MPLVVPGITTDPSDKTEEWTNKLVGKTLAEDGSSDETPQLTLLQTFLKSDLPEQSRIIEPGSMVTKDYNPDRLNVHLKDDGTVSHVQKLKSSIQRALRQSLLTTYPLLGPHIDEVLPKKSSLEQMKLPDRISLFVLDSDPLFFQLDIPSNAPLLPHLRLVHRFPQAFPTVRIDRGAIRFVLGGATLMAPGLTSPGGRLPLPAPASESEEEDDDEAAAPKTEGVDADGHWSRELEKGEPVVVMAEGKDEACAVGLLAMGTKETKAKGKGPVIEETHFLGDGLWRLTID
ncbi:translation machinery-associated protein 20 [Lasiosphaeria miniovina]|uniref:Translation machinery-associated protein 20 n=1 Tax=Lasiosphaeria miniovina TaxID=1954250 RepID=A0AA40DYX8_9PEZI|nr:translation machinery-associated protein 20 [Lasiosphaeria miniovina]KAK0718056.1 translation machinery-associated protein 20 [Lasiosphaeria miniovina]